MSKTKSDGSSEQPTKKARLGVGTSVATVVHKESDPILLCLSQIKVERLLPRGREIITTDRNENLTTAFQKMVTHNILSMPVLTKTGSYYGMLKILDIVRFVIEMFSDLTDTAIIDIENLFASEHRFSKATVNDVVRNPWKRNPYHPLIKGFSLLTAWEMLFLSSCHSVPVMEEDGTIVDLVTQSMLIDFLWQNIEKIGKLSDMEVKDMKFLHAPVVQIKANSTAVIGFREMVNQELAGIAVVDDKERLTDVLSLRDLRGIRPDVKVFYRLWDSVSEFKSKVKKEFPDKTPKTLVYALETDTLYSIVEKMALQHVHRIFVVDGVDTMKPIYIVSQTDVLREIVS